MYMVEVLYVHGAFSIHQSPGYLPGQGVCHAEDHCRQVLQGGPFSKNMPKPIITIMMNHLVMFVSSIMG